MKFRIQWVLKGGSIGTQTFSALPDAMSMASGLALLHKRVSIYVQKDGEEYETLLHEYHNGE